MLNTPKQPVIGECRFFQVEIGSDVNLKIEVHSPNIDKRVVQDKLAIIEEFLAVLSSARPAYSHYKAGSTK